MNKRYILVGCLVLAMRAKAQAQPIPESSFGGQQIITTSAAYAYSVHAADLDNDGDLDVLSASWGDRKIAWYENEGNGSFGEQQVITTDIVGAQDVYAADLDGDGDMDVLSAFSVHDGAQVTWYENDGSGNFGEQQVITTDAPIAHSVYAADLDNDGDLDVLSASSNSIYDNRIAWYENEGNGSFGEQQIITREGFGARSVYAADLDGDGDLDVLSAFYYDNRIVWFENEGNGNFGELQIISTDVNVPLTAYAADLDGDRDLDMLSASAADNKIAWYENDGKGSFGEQQIISIGGEAWSVYAADLDQDGDTDVLSAFRSNNKIAWNDNDGSGNFGEQQVITTDANGVRDVYAADLDGDGDLDVLSASAYDSKIAWYENLMEEEEALAIQSFTLVNAETDQDIQELNDGDIINLSTPGNPLLNVRANTTPDKVDSVIFTFTEPSSGAINWNEYQLVGDAFSTDGCYAVTPDEHDKAGTAWNKHPIDLYHNFDFTFTLNLCSGADGMVFALQQAGLSALGGGGSELGFYYEPTHVFNPSIGIEIDIYNYNGIEPFLYYDPPEIGSHMTLIKNGNPVPITEVVEITPQINNCEDRLLRVVWQSSEKTLEVYLDGEKKLSYTEDIVNTVFQGDPQVYFGFTGATGGSTALQTFCNKELIYNGPSTITTVQTERKLPYALFGDDPIPKSKERDYVGQHLQPGQYTLTAIPYLNGRAGSVYSLTFQVVNELRVQSFTLMNAKTDQDIQPLRDGDVLDLSCLPHQLNIRANVLGEPASVQFKLNGQPVKPENAAPYALFGDHEGNYKPGRFPAGSYELSATPYTGPKATGMAGTALTLRFEVVQHSTINEIVRKEASFSMLATALKQVGYLSKMNQEGPFTLFAPTNEAFHTLLASLELHDVRQIPIPVLREIIQYHLIIGEELYTSDLSDGEQIKTRQYSDVTICIDGATVKVNEARVVMPDMPASNGVVQGIDQVLLPPTETMYVSAMQLEASPNPGASQVSIQVANRPYQRVEVTLMNQYGKPMARQTFDTQAHREASFLLDVSALPPGVYMVQAQLGKERQTLRLIR